MTIYIPCSGAKFRASIPPEDMKADDLGTWRTTRTRRAYFKVKWSGSTEILHKKPSNTMSSTYSLVRRYFVHSSYKKFRRILVEIQDNTNVYTIESGINYTLNCGLF